MKKVALTVAVLALGLAACQQDDCRNTVDEHQRRERRSADAKLPPTTRNAADNALDAAGNAVENAGNAVDNAAAKVDNADGQRSALSHQPRIKGPSAPRGRPFFYGRPKW